MKKIMFFFILTTVLSCKPEEQASSIVLPTELTSSYTINENLLEIQANANGANFYSFVFYDGGDSTYIESVDGSAAYSYTNTGSYVIKTKAHSTHYDFIELIESIEITDVGYTGGIPTTGYTTPDSYPGYTLVWNDEFNGNSLSSDWVYDIGNGSWGWGNNELQFYKEENAVVADGLLKITAKQESFGGYNYTSSRVKTQGIKSFQYGRVDVRAAIPFSQGYWPAIWMLGDDIGSVGWPSCGEIDIMELIGGGAFNDRTSYGTIHWDDNGSHASYGNGNSLSPGSLFAEEFHVFSIIWDSNTITFLRDDIQYHQADIGPSGLSEFHHNFFFILNVAIGGDWPGSPNETTLFPQTMAVDYIRVFQ